MDDSESILPTLNKSHTLVELLSLMGAAILSAGLFLLVPVTQWVDKPDYDKKIIEVNKAVYIPPPSPPPKPLPEIEKIQQKSIQAPQLKRAPETAQIKGLDLNMNIGLGVNLGLKTYGEIEVESEVDVVQTVKDFFTFEDLSQPPRYLTTPELIYPKDLSRRGILQGTIVLLIEIDEKGKAKPMEVISSDHPLLTKEAMRIVARTPFTIPMVNGTPQKVTGEWKITLQAPRRR